MTIKLDVRQTFTRSTILYMQWRADLVVVNGGI